jgi:O-antigen ligase
MINRFKLNLLSHIWLLVFGLFEIPILIYLVYYFSEYLFIFPALVFFSALFFYSIINEEFWVLTSIICYAPLLIIKSEGITMIEIGIACYLFIPLAIWFIKNLYFTKTKIFESTGDYMIIIFYLFCVFSIVITITNNYSPLLWLKEIIVFSGYLFYYPLKKYLKENKNNIYRMLVSFGLLVVIAALYNLYSYRSKVVLATQFFQVWGSRSGATEPLYMAAIIMIVSILFLYKKKIIIVNLVGLLGLSSIALILSFTRSYIGFTVMCIFMLWLFFDKKDKLRFALWVLMLSCISFGLMFLIFNNITKFIFEAVAKRFLEAKGNDMSIVQRIIETEAIIKQISQSPVLGWGLGAKFRRYDLFYEQHVNSNYAHNAYLYLWYKVGLLGLMAFLYAYFEKIIHAIKIRKKTKDNILRNLILSGSIILTAFLFISITSPQYYHRPSILIITILWAIISYAKGNVQNQESIS